MYEEYIEYTSDTDLRERNDNFWIVRILKCVVLALVIIVLITITALFLYQTIIDPVFKQRVLDTIWQQLGTIVIAAFAILGVSRYTNR